MARFLSAVAVALVSVQSARFKREQANSKFIAGVPVFNYDLFDASLVEAGEATWIAMLNSGVTDAALTKLCSALGESCVQGHSSGVPFVSVSASETFLAKVIGALGGAGIKFLEPSTEVIAIPEIRAEARASSWGLERVGSATRRATGKGSHVYVLDTGIRVSHRDFERRAKLGAESVGGGVRVCGSDTSCAADDQGHGTHCAGTVGGKTYGVAPGTSIYAVKVMSDQGRGETDWIISGMDWVATAGARPAVMSMSLGAPYRVRSYKRAVDAVFEAGVVVVVAAGNYNVDACVFSPAYVPNAITVGSTTSTDERSGFSCYGKCVDIWAPGSDITSAAHNSDTGSLTASGTSMACPHVAGAVAALFEEVDSLTAQSTMRTLSRYAQNGYISDLSALDANKFLWIGAPGAGPDPPAQRPPTFAPAPACRRRFFRCS